MAVPSAQSWSCTNVPLARHHRFAQRRNDTKPAMFCAGEFNSESGNGSLKRLNKLKTRQSTPFRTEPQKGRNATTRRPPQSTKLRRRGCLLLQERKQTSPQLSLQAFSLPVSWRLLF